MSKPIDSNIRADFIRGLINILDNAEHEMEITGEMFKFEYEPSDTIGFLSFRFSNEETQGEDDESDYTEIDIELPVKLITGRVEEIEFEEEYPTNDDYRDLVRG